MVFATVNCAFLFNLPKLETLTQSFKHKRRHRRSSSVRLASDLPYSMSATTNTSAPAPAVLNGGKFTPDYEHFLRNNNLRHNVYEPEADTFLFLDGIDVEEHVLLGRLLNRLRDRAGWHFATMAAAASSEREQSGGCSSSSSTPPPPPQPFSAVEIGCGSGLVITHLGMTCQRALVRWSLDVQRAEREAAKMMENEEQQVQQGEGNGPRFVGPPREDSLVAASVLAALTTQRTSSGSSSSSSSLPPLLLSPPFADFYFVDINPLALESAKQTWGINMSAQMAAMRQEVEGTAVVAASSSTTAPLKEEDGRAPVTLLLDGGNNEAVYGHVTKHLAASSSSSSSSLSTSDCTSSLFSCTGILGSLFAPFLKEKKSSEGEDVGAEGAENGQHGAVGQVTFDVALFNPPYVPTDMEELEKATIENDILTAAWCGGPRGRVVVDKFLQQVFKVLRPMQSVVVERQKLLPLDNNAPNVAAPPTEQQQQILLSHPPLHALYPSTGLLYIVAIRENDVGDLCAFTNDEFCAVDEVRVAAEKKQLFESIRASLPAANSSAPPPAEDALTILGAQLACSTVTERWTGEHLSILKFEMIPEGLEDAVFGDDEGEEDADEA